jgi:hypothetical protein
VRCVAGRANAVESGADGSLIRAVAACVASDRVGQPPPASPPWHALLFSLFCLLSPLCQPARADYVGEVWRGGEFVAPLSVSADDCGGSCWVADTANGQVVRLAYYYTLIFTGDSGRITVDGVSHALPRAEDIAIGSLVTLEAVPEAASEFLGWSGDFSGATTPMTITADADYIIGVEFTGAGHARALTASGEGTILVDGVEQVTPWSARFEPGTSVTLEPLPAEGWRFARWAGDPAGQGNPAAIVMDGDKQIEACFAAALADVPPGRDCRARPDGSLHCAGVRSTQ